MKKSVLWNARGIFFFINEDPESYCTNTNHTLIEAWRFNILQAIYVCLDERKSTQYYTINPFTNKSIFEAVEIIKHGQLDWQKHELSDNNL